MRNFGHHAVWRKPSGELVEVTPRDIGDGLSECIPCKFIPDESATLIPKNGRLTLRPLKSVPLVDHPAVRKLSDYTAAAIEADYRDDDERFSYYQGRAHAALKTYQRTRLKA